MEIKRELGNVLGLKGKGTFEKVIKYFFYFRKSSRRNEETYEEQPSKLSITVCLSFLNRD